MLGSIAALSLDFCVACTPYLVIPTPMKSVQLGFNSFTVNKYNALILVVLWREFILIYIFPNT